MDVFVSMSTQWRSAGYGATGLDYGPLPGVMRMCGVGRKEWPDVFEGIRILEDAALYTMQIQREREQRAADANKQRGKRG